MSCCVIDPEYRHLSVCSEERLRTQRSIYVQPSTPRLRVGSIDTQFRIQKFCLIIIIVPFIFLLLLFL